jgi:hypothetical protein
VRSVEVPRLPIIAREVGVDVDPQQARRDGNVLTVETILWHKYVDMPLCYSWLYDGIVAADYYRAMGEIERRLGLRVDAPDQPPGGGEPPVLLDAPHIGTLNDAQPEIVQTLRMAILAIDIDGTTDDEDDGSSAKVVWQKRPCWIQ